MAAVRLKAGLRTVWRSPITVQVGLDPARGAVLDGLTAADRDLVERLATGAPTHPCGEREWALVHLLDDAGLLICRPTDPETLAQLGPARGRFVPDAQAWSLLGGDDDGWCRLVARRTRTVQLHDRLGSPHASRVMAVLVVALTAAGVGAVRTPLTEPGRRRPPAGGPGPSGASGASGLDADLRVLLERDAADAQRATALLAADVAHLSVVVREGGIDVGPLVLPGRSPCLRCLDLHRTDRDPDWPRVLAQLVSRPGAAPPLPEDATLAQLAGALAALQVLGHLDALGDAPGTPDNQHGAIPTRPPSSVAATLEVRLPDGLVTRRPWTAHPECGCRWPPRAPASNAQDTMSR